MPPINLSFKVPPVEKIIQTTRDGLTDVAEFQARIYLAELIKRTPVFTGRAMLALQPAAQYLHIPLETVWNYHRWNMYGKTPVSATQIWENPITYSGKGNLTVNFNINDGTETLEYVDWNENTATGCEQDGGEFFVNRPDTKHLYHKYKIVKGLIHPTPWNRASHASAALESVSGIVTEMYQNIVNQIADALNIEM